MGTSGTGHTVKLPWTIACGGGLTGSGTGAAVGIGVGGGFEDVPFEKSGCGVTGGPAGLFFPEKLAEELHPVASTTSMANTTSRLQQGVKVDWLGV